MKDFMINKNDIPFYDEIMSDEPSSSKIDPTDIPFYDEIGKNSSGLKYDNEFEQFERRADIGNFSDNEYLNEDDDRTDPNINEKIADRQPWAIQLKNAFVRVNANIIPEAIGTLANALDFEDYNNSDQEVGNWLTNLMDEQQESIDERFPIYRKNPGKPLDFGDKAWWFDNGSSLVKSIGSFAISGGVISKSLQGLSKLAKIDKLAKTIMGANASQKTGNVLNTGINATMLNQAEGIMEATDVYDSTYKYQLEKLKQNNNYNSNSEISLDEYIENEARQKAADAASLTIETNRANILLNLTSANLFLKSPFGTRTLLKKQSKFASATRAGLEGAQESAEEVINLIAGDRGRAFGKDEDYSVKNVISNINAPEAIEAALLGFVGGLGQTVATEQGINRISKVNDPSTGQQISLYEHKKNQYNKQQEALSELDEMSNSANVASFTTHFDNLQATDKINKAYAKAKEEDNEVEMERLRKLHVSNMALRSFQGGTTDRLIKLFEELKKGPQKEGMNKDYKEKADEAINIIKDLEKEYNNSSSYINMGEVFMNRSEYKALNNELNSFLKTQEDIASDLQKEIDVQLNRYSKSKFNAETNPNGVQSISIEQLLTGKDIEGMSKSQAGKLRSSIMKSPEYAAYSDPSSDEYIKSIDDLIDENINSYKDITSEKYQKSYSKKLEEKNKKIEQELEENAKLEELLNSVDQTETLEDLDSITTDNEKFNQRLGDRKDIQREKIKAKIAARNEVIKTNSEAEANDKDISTQNEIDSIINNYNEGESINTEDIDIPGDLNTEKSLTVKKINEDGSVELTNDNGESVKIGSDTMFKSIEKQYSTDKSNGEVENFTNEDDSKENIKLDRNDPRIIVTNNISKQEDGTQAELLPWIDPLALDFEREPVDKTGQSKGITINKGVKKQTNNIEAKKADIEKKRQEIAEEGFQELNQGGLTDDKIDSLPTGVFRRVWGYLRGKLGGNIDYLINLTANPSDYLLDLNKVLSGVKISRIGKAYSSFINELEKRTIILNDKLNERVNKGLREGYPQSSMDRLTKERDAKVLENNNILQKARELNDKYDAELDALESSQKSEQQTSEFDINILEYAESQEESDSLIARGYTYAGKNDDGLPAYNKPTQQNNESTSTFDKNSNWQKAIDMYDANDFSDLNFLINHLPLNIQLTDNTVAGIETKPASNKNQKVFNETSKLLREAIIKELAEGSNLSNMKVSIGGQANGELQIQPGNPENNIKDLYDFDGDVSNIKPSDIYISTGIGLENADGDMMPTSRMDIAKGEVYIKIKMANGKDFPLKLNIKRLDSNEASLLYDLYKYRLEDKSVGKGVLLQNLPDTLQDEIKDKFSKQLELFNDNNQSFEELSIKDLVDFIIWDGTKNTKTQIRIYKDNLIFGNNVLNIKQMESKESKDDFINFITNEKTGRRHQVKFKPRKNESDNSLTIQNPKYLAYLINNKILNTNAVVNEHTFQGKTTIYLDKRSLAVNGKVSNYSSQIPKSYSSTLIGTKSILSGLSPRLYNRRHKVKLTEDGSQYVENINGVDVFYDRVSTLKLSPGETEIDSTKPNIYNAAKRGDLVDLLLRDFFRFTNFSKEDFNKNAQTYIDKINKEKPNSKLTFTADFFEELYNIAEQYKNDFNKRNYTLFSEAPTLSGKINGKNYAGTVDLLAYDKNNGEWVIIDFKTSNGDRGLDYKGKDQYNYKGKDAIQQNAYARLFEQVVGVQPSKLFILPLIVKPNERNGTVYSTVSKSQAGDYLNVDMSKNIDQLKNFNKKPDNSPGKQSFEDAMSDFNAYNVDEEIPVDASPDANSELEIVEKVIPKAEPKVTPKAANATQPNEKGMDASSLMDKLKGLNKDKKDNTKNNEENPRISQKIVVPLQEDKTKDKMDKLDFSKLTNEQAFTIIRGIALKYRAYSKDIAVASSKVADKKNVVAKLEKVVEFLISKGISKEEVKTNCKL